MIDDLQLESMEPGTEPVAGKMFRVQVSDVEHIRVHVGCQDITLRSRTESQGCLSIDVPANSGGMELRVEGWYPNATATGRWKVQHQPFSRRNAMRMKPAETLSMLFPDPASPPQRAFRLDRHWSYGDVENNGVFYHPNLTHYAHQAFEEWFLARTGMHYVDLSRDSERSNARRAARGYPRMTFPVEWLHQFMQEPMEAGDQYTVLIEVVELDTRRVGVRAWILNASGATAALVMWVRWAVLLPDRTSVDIPGWFPRE